MDQQPRHFTREVHHQKVDKTKPKAKEVKVLNTEPNELQDTNVTTLVLNLLTTAAAFKIALKNLKANHEYNEVQKKEIFGVLVDIQNITKLKILSLKKGQTSRTERKSPKTCKTQCSTESSAQSLVSFLSELASRSSTPDSSRNNSVDSVPEAFSTAKLKSLSRLSLCSTKSSQYGYSDGDDYDVVVDNNDVDVNDDGEDDEKFKEFLESVNCPFCLKREDNKNTLVKHLDRACTPFKNKKFTKSLDCPYSVFQILPNNAFKCNICPASVQSNLKSYFVHCQSANHISIYNKAVSRKNYTELIFCASCKIQIPNNPTQIMFHVRHEVHQRNRKDLRSTFFFQQRGIQCVYSKEKKFKCLSCPLAKAIHKSVKEILLHFESEAHVRRVSSLKPGPRKLSAVYCMFCLEEVNVFNVVGHFNSSRHAQKEEEENCNEFELCFYCGFKCSNLNILALHMQDCPALDLIRQECEKFDRILTEIEKDQKKPTNETTSEKGRCIIVKDYPKVLELYHYFNQFGKVLEIESSGENAVLIKFQEEKTVDNILERSSHMEINGVKLKITRREDLESSDTILESSRTAESTNSCPVASNESDVSLASHNVIGVSSSTVHEDFSKLAVDDGALESLFNRVSSHLSYTVLKPDCEEFLNIALDCDQILKFGKCHSIGFLKCGLTFPVEKITLYCELSNSLIKEQCSNDNSRSLTESVLFNENLCKTCVRLFKNADVVSKVRLREKSFPFVEFYHNKTHKLCTITFRQSDHILADELRCCLKDNKKLRSFVLIIRFWLSVHRLEISEFESVIISLLLYFLLSSGIVNTTSENFRKKPEHVLLYDSLNYFTNEGCMGRNQNVRKESSVMEMFQNFLLFLNQFDFENKAICLPLVCPVFKTTLMQDRLKKLMCRGFDLNSPVWIMDPFLYNNLAVDVKKADWDSLLKTVRKTIEHYKIT